MRVPTRQDRDPAHREELDRLLGEQTEAIAETREPMRVVAIVGRPNVGKSTLFNRIIGRRKAIVHDRPGVTRDRNLEVARWGGIDFLCVDTGGFDIELDDPLLASVVEQVDLAVEQADVIVFLAAVHETAHPADEEIVRRLRGKGKPVIAAINKCDSPALELEANDFYRYGFDHIFPISAQHGRNCADLLDAMVEALRTVEPRTLSPSGEGQIRLAIVGRQNVGKSTLVNQLAGEQRVIVADFAGTTRDSIDTDVRTPDGRVVTLIDTAGIRRRGRVERGIEKLSVLSSMLSLERANVAALVLDATQGPTDQDAHIAGYCVDAGLPTMILVNKWDLVEKDHRTADLFTKVLEDKWGFMRHCPVLYLSALTGQRARRVFELTERIYTNGNRRVPTHELNEQLAAWVGQRPPATWKNRTPKIRYITQVGVMPPTFALFVNDPEALHFTYRRYLVNRFREAYDFEGSPIRLVVRSSKRSKTELPEGPAEG